MLNEVHAPITTPEGQRDWLSPVDAIAHTAAGIPLDHPLSTKLTHTFPAPLMASVDPDGEFLRQLQKGIFVVSLERDSLQAHHYMTIINKPQGSSPNFYVTINELSGLGIYDKAFSIPSHHDQLSVLDPDGNLPRLVKFTPEVNAATPPQEVSLFGRFLAWAKQINAIAFIVNTETPGAPYGAEQ